MGFGFLFFRSALGSCRSVRRFQRPERRMQIDVENTRRRRRRSDFTLCCRKNGHFQGNVVGRRNDHISVSRCHTVDPQARISVQSESREQYRRVGRVGNRFVGNRAKRIRYGGTAIIIR